MQKLNKFFLLLFFFFHFQSSHSLSMDSNDPAWPLAGIYGFCASFFLHGILKDSKDLNIDQKSWICIIGGISFTLLAKHFFGEQIKK